MARELVSISTCFDYSVPIERQLAVVSEAGFTHISLGQDVSHFDYLSKQDRASILRLLARHSLRIDTIHGPQADKTESGELAAIAEAAIDLQAPVIVLHGGPFDFAEDELDSRLEKLRRTCVDLDSISRRTGVVFALENVMPGPATEVVRRAILEADHRTIGFCYDSSHDQIGGPNPFDLLADLKERLVAVHLSDRLKEFEDHVIPGAGFIDWDRLCAILAGAHTTFPLLLEVMTMYSAQKDLSKFLSQAFKTGCELFNRIQV